MIKANLGKEIVFKTINDIGVVADVSKSLAQRGISMLAVSAWVEGAYGIIHMTTDDNRRALDCLNKKFQVRENSVISIELPNKVGMLKRVTEKLKAEKIDIHHLFATALPTHEKCLVVFSTSNNDRAILAMKKATLRS